jgi:hypothetical protein
MKQGLNCSTPSLPPQMAMGLLAHFSPIAHPNNVLILPPDHFTQIAFTLIKYHKKVKNLIEILDRLYDSGSLYRTLKKKIKINFHV